MNIKTLIILIIAIPTFSYADNFVGCVEHVQNHYAYQMEILLHSYETTGMRNRDFEKQRYELVKDRDSEFSLCTNSLAQMDDNAIKQNLSDYMDDQTTQQSDASATRSIASVPTAQRNAKSLKNQHQNLPSEAECLVEENEVHTHNERVMVEF